MGQRKPTSTNWLNEALLEERCVLNKAVKLIGQRWTAEILLLIEQDVNRFSQLKEQLEGISDNVLSQKLNELIASGILSKQVFGEIPVRVEYSLSKGGRELMNLLHQLCQWGRHHLETGLE